MQLHAPTCLHARMHGLQVGTLAVSAGGEVAGGLKGVGSRVAGVGQAMGSRVAGVGQAVGSKVAGVVRKPLQVSRVRITPCAGQRTYMPTWQRPCHHACMQGHTWPLLAGAGARSVLFQRLPLPLTHSCSPSPLPVQVFGSKNIDEVDEEDEEVEELPVPPPSRAQKYAAVKDKYKDGASAAPGRGGSVGYVGGGGSGGGSGSTAAPRQGAGAGRSGAASSGRRAPPPRSDDDDYDDDDYDERR